MAHNGALSFLQAQWGLPLTYQLDALLNTWEQSQVSFGFIVISEYYVHFLAKDENIYYLVISIIYIIISKLNVILKMENLAFILKHSKDT